MRIDEIIRKLDNGKYRLYSKSGKNLGTYDTRSGAENREREVQYFKHNESQEVMPSVKTPGVEEISRKHGVSTQQIKNQLRKGIRVEYEHTQDKKMSREIALDHLAELPDYYDRLAKMEVTKKKSSGV